VAEGDPRPGLDRDLHITEEGSAVAGGVDPETQTSSATFRVEEDSHREVMTADLMKLSLWLSEHPKELRRNLKHVRGTLVLDPGVYYNAGIRMIERLYRPQHSSLGNRMYRVSHDPAAPVDEIRRKVLEGK
jgi:hypothetical protein